jgi:hypothetical protein
VVITSEGIEMPYYSTDSQEHRINTGKEADPYLEDGMQMDAEDWDAWDRFIEECHDED